MLVQFHDFIKNKKQKGWSLKTMQALNKYMKRENTPNKVLEACIKERNEMRDDNDNCQ